MRSGASRAFAFDTQIRRPAQNPSHKAGCSFEDFAQSRPGGHIIHNTESPEAKQRQCSYIFAEGSRCSSPCQNHEEFCYHHTTRPSREEEPGTAEIVEEIIDRPTHGPIAAADYAQTEEKLSVTPTHHNWLYRRIALPVFALLRLGATPEKLAWSIACGLLIGINPILGSTTVLCLAVAFVFRLNIAASQLGNHVVYPLQILLVIPFLRMGSRLFRTAPIPLSAAQLLHAAREHPLELIRRLWLWEWHAFLVWALLTVIAIPLCAVALTPLFRRLLVRVQRHQYPILSTPIQPR